MSTEEEEAIMKRNLFKRIEEANNTKAADNVEFKPSSKTHLLELLEVLCSNSNHFSSSKTISLGHPKLKLVRENFSKPSPDQLIHISRND